jgi:hypothetical protein
MKKRDNPKPLGYFNLALLFFNINQVQQVLEVMGKPQIIVGVKSQIALASHTFN